MATDLHTAAKQALEALEKYCTPYKDGTHPADEAITDLRQTLANEALDKMAENARELGIQMQPAHQQEPVGTVQCITGVTIGYLDVMQPVGTKLYTSLQPAQPRKPLPFNKEDMEGLDVNQRLGFKLGWKSAEEAHGIKENT